MPKLVRNLLNFFNTSIIKHGLFSARYDYLNNIVTVRKQVTPELGRSIINSKLFTQEDLGETVTSTLKN